MEKLSNTHPAPIAALCALFIVSPASRAEVDAPPIAAQPATAGAAARAQAPLTQAEQDEVLYALGLLISRNLDDYDLSGADFERVKSGLIDGFNHRASGVDPYKEGTKIQALRRERMARMHGERERAAQAFVERAAAQSGAQRTASGLVFIALRKGTGPSPGPADQVTVNYEGRLINGSVFDGTRERGTPATFSLRSVIPCWSEALPLMKVGAKSRIVCPAALAYGAHGEPPKVGPDAALDFEVELLAVKKADSDGGAGAP
jgi:FKBP-type peptidyl-prolyl cis-trans isomerase